MLYSFNEYKTTDCGKWGKAGERAEKVHFKQTDKVSAQGHIDTRRDRKCFENKTGAGELDFLYKSTVKYVKYIPVVDENKPIEKQEGFIFERTVFLEMLESLGLVRIKESEGRPRKITIQTFWNHSKNKPHGKKYFALLDACYSLCIMTYEEYFELGGKF